MKTEKIGSKLVFHLDDGTTVQYDLASKETIGKRGKPVQSLRSQLGCMSADDIIESIEDVGYREFLRWVRRKASRGLFNFGSILELAKNYAKYEQNFAAGIYNFDNNINIKDVPKGLLKFVRENDLKLTRELQMNYEKNPDIFSVFLKEEYRTIGVSEFVKIVTYGSSTYNWGENRSQSLRLIQDHSYNMKALLRYIDDIATYEALDTCEVLRNLTDYVRMMSKLSPKFEKYPRYLRTTHDIAVRNYNRLTEKYEEDKFAETVREDFEKTIDDYIFVCPRTAQDIKDEAVQQNNCVASYIKLVINKSCNIIFMRKKGYKDKSVVTLEIKDNKVIQAKGKFNRELTEKENEVLAKYKKYLLSLKEEENEKAS